RRRSSHCSSPPHHTPQLPPDIPCCWPCTCWRGSRDSSRCSSPPHHTLQLPPDTPCCWPCTCWRDRCCSPHHSSRLCHSHPPKAGRRPCSWHRPDKCHSSPCSSRLYRTARPQRGRRWSRPETDRRLSNRRRLCRCWRPGHTA